RGQAGRHDYRLLPRRAAGDGDALRRAHAGPQRAALRRILPGLAQARTSAREPEREEMKYADPYVSGVALGLVLLAAFVFAGRGPGASGAVAATATGTVAAVAPAYAEANPYFARYLSRPGGPWREWLLFEIAGVLV